MTPPGHNEGEAAWSSSPYRKEFRQSRIRQRGLYMLCKRALDVTASGVGLVLLSPLLLIVAICIKLEDPKGKVLFSQIRVGKQGQTFRMYKFRSMVHDAEAQLEKLLKHNEVEGAMFKMKDDPRITRIGRFIRKTSIDELPQLLNVLRGEMSLVGPRPPLPREVEAYTNYDRQRLAVTPGCTGLWQVSGRNELSFAQMVELDLKYIRNRSMLLDLKILVLTVKVILFPNSAY
ncbi:sugar transferase [Paenibacillus sp. GCM10012307]|uniref:Sugar transferase n=1 Tax=Paenibacillus roseus TaxID=2798579 RepID=A0A934MNU9_9BACL|nr:sugar transferase [Paenibacillus roseus]MBJ6359784.1 sugar transferase [Paenibacillus roseus]